MKIYKIRIEKDIEVLRKEKGYKKNLIGLPIIPCDILREYHVSEIILEHYYNNKGDALNDLTNYINELEEKNDTFFNEIYSSDYDDKDDEDQFFVSYVVGEDEHGNCYRFNAYIIEIDVI